jgi:hypothetical protein
MSNICSRCGSVVNTLTITTGTPPWCPVCGADFQPAAKNVAGPAKQAPTAPSADIVPLTVAAPARPAARTAQPRSTPRVPRQTVPLPAGVPADVAARGDPEGANACDEEQYERNRTLVQIFFGLLAFLFLAVAVFHLYTLYQPVNGYDLSEATARGIGIGTAILAVLFFAGGVVLPGTGWAAGWWRPRTYLVHEDVLVEVWSGQHRAIPWEKVGEGEFNAVVGRYRFPVAGGRALTFDSTLREHETFARTIKEYAAARRFWVAFGDEAALSEMKAASVGPSVLACTLGRAPVVYRMTLLGERLLFYQAGWVELCDHPDPVPIPAMGLAGGLISGFNALARAHARQKSEELRRRVEAADAPTLVKIAQEQEGSFVASPADVSEIRLDPPRTSPGLASFLAGTNGPEQTCLLGIEHARQGSLRFALLSRDHVLTIVGEWAKVFGEAVKVNVAWSHSKCTFVSKP